MINSKPPLSEFRGFFIYSSYDRGFYDHNSNLCVTVHRMHNDEWMGNFEDIETAEFAIKCLTEVETAKAFEQEILGIKHGKESSSKKRSKRRSINKC